LIGSRLNGEEAISNRGDEEGGGPLKHVLTKYGLIRTGKGLGTNGGTILF